MVLTLAAMEAVYWIDVKDQRRLLSWRDPGQELQDLLVAKLASPRDWPNIVDHDVSRGLLGAIPCRPAVDPRAASSRMRGPSP
jgi:hypothetical protein